MQVVDINPPVSDTEPTEGVVSGKAGLFIGISKVSFNFPVLGFTLYVCFSYT